MGKSDPTIALKQFKEGNADALIKWYEDGADGAINWCSPGDFDDCVAVAGKHLDNPEGFCQERHISVCGGPAGSEDHASRGVSVSVTLERQFERIGDMGAKSRDALIRQWNAGSGRALIASAGTLTRADRALFEAYPWEDCMSDQQGKGYDKETAAKICGSIKAQNASAVGESLASDTDPSEPYKPEPYKEDDDELVVCPKCKKNDDNDAHFCDQCGFDLTSTGFDPAPYKEDPDETIVCPSCKKHDDTDAVYCDQCGFKLEGAKGVIDTTSEVPAPEDDQSDQTDQTDQGDASAPAPAMLQNAARAAKFADVSPDASAGPAPDTTQDAPNPDAEVSAAIQMAEVAISKAIAAQKADPDNGTDPNDAKVLEGLENAATELASIAAAQKADEAGEAQPDASAQPPADQQPATQSASMASTTPGNAEGVPGDADDSPPAPGDVDPNAECQNPECNHLASAHDDTDDGENTGPCAMQNCTCPGMVMGQPGDQVVGPEDSNSGMSAGTQAFVDPPAASGPADAAPAEDAASGTSQGQNAAPQAPEVAPIPETELGPAFTMPVAALENTPTGDGRIISSNALTWRTPPLPLMGLDTMPHDPSGFSQNDPAVICGNVESIERQGNVIVAKGHFHSTAEGQKFSTLLGQMGRMGVSIDVGSVSISISGGELDPIDVGGDVAFDSELMETLVSGEIMGITICPFAAFAGAYIVLGDGSDAPAANLEQAPADSQMAIRYFDSEDGCEPCEVAPALVASMSAPSGGPIAPPREWFEDPEFFVGDGFLVETLDSKSGRSSGKFACPMTVTEDGRVFGHIAQWGVCHQGMDYVTRGQCVMAPRSNTEYALFHSGSLLTAEGDVIGVGRLTADANHASPTKQLTLRQVNDHYDHSGVTVAFVRAGEDEFGIWVAGSVHPAASAEQVMSLRGNPPSGDWRPYGKGLELTAVLCVNTPGFPLVHAGKTGGGKVTSLVAAGVPLFTMPESMVKQPSLLDRIGAIESTVETLAPLAVETLKTRFTALRD